MKPLYTLLLCITCFIGFSQDGDSPYLLVATENANIPLKSSITEVNIAGTIAHVRVTQVYQNKGAEAIEAKYVFPLSTQAAVHKMHMIVDERLVIAKIFEKQEAQKVYDSALQEGKRAAKLDQHRPNVFQMNVGNIMPGDEITLDIYYTEILVPVNGEYQFVAPAVVGPRFTGENTDNEESFNMPYTAKGIANTFNYDISVRLNAGMIIQNVTSASHHIAVDYPDAKTAEIILSEENKNPSNRDFILNYNLRGNQIQTGLLMYEGEDENFFTFQMEPNINVVLDDIPAREYLFIVDVSGSMNGYPLEVSRTLMRNLLCGLRMTDTFNVQLFASSSTIFSPTPVEINEQNIEAAIRFLSEGQGGGGTQLLSALQTAYKLPRKDMSVARSMVVITDGYVSVEKEAFELIANNLDQANVFTFGIGSSVNRYLIEGVAKVSNSESFIATTSEEAAEVAKDFANYIATPLLTRVKVEARGFDMYDLAQKSIPDVFAARPVVVHGKYRGKAEGKIIITGYQGKKRFREVYNVSDGSVSKTNRALGYLWARKKIAELDDYKKLFNEDVKAEVVALGLKYNLLTNYTSFVAVDETIVNKDGTLKNVKQPLPMSENVNNSAVGAEAEVKESSKFKRTFTIDFDNEIEKNVKRQLTMEFKVMYSKLVTDYLKKYDSLRIKFNAEGKVVCVEKLENGIWTIDETIQLELEKISLKSVKKEMTLTLKK
ncbi:Ca-activated chloride channel family protein [Maribacter caenipelagi]|uniref:Ca-activated chloride channel family protein n=1 Tax=Maribacter caenipelagi TaxID=1447781 RepID=A0A4R7D0H2_9FLAO|nr:VIT and VWA domain-containing protein [Maribacter caenipelagi]TDS14170.1 Ca-activated chloride channel family protein [Maribacter caenipelagi]